MSFKSTKKKNKFNWCCNCSCSKAQPTLKNDLLSLARKVDVSRFFQVSLLDKTPLWVCDIGFLFLFICCQLIKCFNFFVQKHDKLWFGFKHWVYLIATFHDTKLISSYGRKVCLCTFTLCSEFNYFWIYFWNYPILE